MGCTRFQPTVHFFRYLATAQTYAVGSRATLGFCKPLAPTPTANESLLAVILFFAGAPLVVPLSFQLMAYALEHL